MTGSDPDWQAEPTGRLEPQPTAPTSSSVWISQTVELAAARRFLRGESATLPSERVVQLS